MRISIFVLFLAFAKCKQVCQMVGYTQYLDAECTQKKDEPEENIAFITARANQMMENGTQCQYFNPQGFGPKVKITCLDSETFKIENFNHQNEDEECQYPYPGNSDVPSYVAKSGECVRTTPTEYSMFIIESSGLEESEEVGEVSWEVPYEYKPDDDYQSEEEIKDNSPEASSCMMQTFEMFLDSECQVPYDGIDEETMQLFAGLANQQILSTECAFATPGTDKGGKARAYCEDPYTLTFKIYNFMNEDPYCMRPYPYTAKYNSYTVKSGDCVKVDPEKFARITVVPNQEMTTESNQTWNESDWNQTNNTDAGDWNESDWNQTNQTDTGDWNETDWNQNASTGKGNGFKMEGDGYEVSIQMEKDRYGADQITSEQKFDQYFMYGIDNMEGNIEDMPVCGPDVAYDPCKELANSENTCCTHVVLSGLGDDYSFYRCMNQKIVDMSFNMQIDDMKMSMACTGGASSATFMKSAILASSVALISMTIF